jgi:chemotaxis protein CheX
MVRHEEMVEMVRTAARDVFTTMLELTPAPGPAYTSTTAPPSSNGVVSLVGLAGSWVGSGTIFCTAECACHIASQLMMCRYEAVNDEVLDAMAEVTNMVIGNVKTLLEERLGPLGLSIPTVIYGRNFTSRTVGQQEWTVVPFSVDDQRVEVQVCLAPNRNASHARFALTGQQAVEI